MLISDVIKSPATEIDVTVQVPSEYKVLLCGKYMYVFLKCKNGHSKSRWVQRLQAQNHYL